MRGRRWLAVALLLAGCGSGPPAPRPVGRRAPVYGDLNGNGRLDAADATRVLRCVVGLDPLPADLATVDFNGNGQVDAADATKVLRVVVALDPALAIPPRYGGGTVDDTHGALRGLVTGAVGQPLAGVIVWLAGTSNLFATGADGTFSFPLVSPGNYSLVCEAPGGTLTHDVRVVAGAVTTADFQVTSVTPPGRR